MKRYIGLGLLMIMMWILVGCGGQVAVEPTVTPVPVEPVEDKIVAEAVVLPVHSVTLRAESGGTVTELAVAVGEHVAAGEVLLHLDPADASLAVQEAEVALDLAKARLNLVQAAARPETIAVLEAQLAAADAAVAQIAARRDVQTAGLQAADALDAQAELTAAQVAHRQADDVHNATMKCFDYTDVDGSVKKACPALGTFEELTRAEMEAAYAAMIAAQAQLAAVEGQSAPQVRAAQAALHAAIAQRDATQSRLDLAQAGNQPEAIVVAEAAVQHATAALARAEAQLALCALKAPFSGTVTALRPKPGHIVAAGDALVTIATLDHLQIRTTDLNELDVTHLVVGQRVTVKLDAQIDVVLSGHVMRVEPQSVKNFDDVTYPVVIELDAPAPPWVRWGMRGQVDIVWGE